MTSMSGLLSAISKSIPYASMGTVESHEPSRADSDTGPPVEHEGHKQRSRHSADTSYLLQGLYSNAEVRNRMRDKDPTAEPMQIESCLTPFPGSRTSLRLSRSNEHPSSSMSQVETSLPSNVQVNEDIAEHQRAVVKPQDISGMVSSDTLPQTKDTKIRPSFKGSLSSIRSSSDPVLREASILSNNPDLNKPLKTCLKQKAQSASTTPPNGPVTMTMTSNKSQKLRRVKTVDFEDSISDNVPLCARNSCSTKRQGKSKPSKASERAQPCPGRARLTRRLPACPAVTRTDVHVVAIAPVSSGLGSLGPAQPREGGETDPATPTMQIVESDNGSYEVIWDNLPPEHSMRKRRHSSFGSQALKATSPTATGSLERVNTKLSEWSGTWNAPSEFFKPTVVVFPEDDGRRPRFECATVDDEEIEIFAPPNSERASAVHSQHPSRPVSAPMSRAHSQDWFSATRPPQDMSLDTSALPTEQTLAMPDSDAWSAHLVAARRKLGASSPEQGLSNLDEAEMRFRNHRDSVTIAHSRLVHSGGVKPELLAHSDSVSLAKKRMHARKSATSAAHHTHRSKARSESGRLPDDNAAAMLPLPIVKAYAAEALRKASPVSILRSTESSATQHVRIGE
ncbi:hypothetical protein EKO04_004971 [Ascochyta lentis]|uniref:Uncharacterized protein n=1 Tax=Ascochyta lentis TaxID=205686 RepID=A0A8H7MJD1_9PLEO|nr:hypothetical protein EKO04_004971 [Ascochyta lentis]